MWTIPRILANPACALLLFCLARASGASAQTFTSLFSFGYPYGCVPQGALIQGIDGNLYGTTPNGGCDNGGTVFKITPDGRLTTLVGLDNPNAGLIQTVDGDFYGTTSEGGTDNAGTVFKLTPAGTLTTLHSFDYKDGWYPLASLVQGDDGNFYGTTVEGGAYGKGTVFKVTPDGVFTTLWDFCHLSGCGDGVSPESALIEGTDGNFYGTTAAGGAHRAGTVFRITPTGNLTRLYSFCSQSGCADGWVPHASLIQATDGNFYGTTEVGGTNPGCPDGCGTVFKITPTGTFTTIYNFCARGCAEGSYAYAPLIQATDGNFYSTTFSGGIYSEGIVFQLTPGGTLTTLHAFCSKAGCPDGEILQQPVVQETDGRFYGTTEYGGTNSLGTVFALSVGLGPFVRTQPTAAKAGMPVNILGKSLNGATSVTFNGIAAAFTVESGSLIRTSVPEGASTGLVQVATPSGTLSSNVPFRVIP